MTPYYYIADETTRVPTGTKLMVIFRDPKDPHSGGPYVCAECVKDLGDKVRFRIKSSMWPQYPAGDELEIEKVCTYYHPTETEPAKQLVFNFDAA